MSFVYLPLAHRSIVKMSGADAASFLQGYITNDIFKVSPTNTIYSAFLTPQGRFLDDFFILSDCHNEGFVLDVSQNFRATLIQKLMLYKLRANITITPCDDLKVFALLSSSAFYKNISEIGHTIYENNIYYYCDPRHAGLGTRVIAQENDFLAQMTAEKIICDTQHYYEHTRLKLAIPDSQRDMPSAKAIILEYGLNDLHALDWKKGCYMGQELMARTHHRGQVRKVFCSFSYPSSLDLEGKKEIYTSTKEKAGEIRSFCAPFAVGLFYKEKIDSVPLTIDGHCITLLSSKK